MFYNGISNLHPSLKFTSEEEADGSLPFLDVFLQRTSNSLQMSVSRKLTFAGQYIPWCLFFRKQQKLSLISCLVFRSFKICSDTKVENELDNIRNIICVLGYPFDKVDKPIRQTISNIDKPKLYGPKKMSGIPTPPIFRQCSSFLEDKYNKQLL